MELLSSQASHGGTERGMINACGKREEEEE